jgi:SAM-dependent methyltransferase
VRRLAGLVTPGGQAVGVEPDGPMRAEAERRTAAERSPATFVDGDAGALPFDDGSIDVLRCERVFQHLPDPVAAAREFARVLAPGGRAVVVDSDWGSVVQTAGDPDVVRRIDEFARSLMANPFAGRHLPGQLHRAGLRVDPDVAATAVVMPEEMLRGLAIFRPVLDLALAEDVLTPAEVAQFESDVQEALDRGEAFFAVTMFAVLARKGDATAEVG